MEVHRDAHVYDTGMVTIIEIMGRHAGWLAGSAALATWAGYGPDLIYLPETDFDLTDFLDDVHRVYDKTGKCMVAVSEGIHRADGTFISEAKTSATDGDRGQGPRHRTLPAPALRLPHCLQDRHRRGFPCGQGSRGGRRIRHHR